MSKESIRSETAKSFPIGFKNEIGKESEANTCQAKIKEELFLQSSELRRRTI